MSTSLKKIHFQALLWWVFLNTPEVLQTSQVQQGNFPESGNEGGSPPLETETRTHDVTHSFPKIELGLSSRYFQLAWSFSAILARKTSLTGNDRLCMY